MGFQIKILDCVIARRFVTGMTYTVFLALPCQNHYLKVYDELGWFKGFSGPINGTDHHA
jgi:hypothetical protein